MRNMQGEEQRVPTIPDGEPDTVTERTQPDVRCNPFVAYLNSLHSVTAGSENALAESQSVNCFFGYIHVPLPVTDYIFDTLTETDGTHVILTGHAGDGKSTIGLELYKRLKHLPHKEPLSRPMNPREMLQTESGREVVLIKDMSELSAETRRQTLDEATCASDVRFLIISNTGTLLETFCSFYEDTERFAFEDELLRIMSSQNPKELRFFDADFLIINLAHVDHIETTGTLLERMVATERWETCSDQKCREKCPIYRNVKLIQDNLVTVRDRVLLAYRRMFEYGERLTLRQMSAHLAYMITAGLTDEQIASLSQSPNPKPMVNFLFFNRFFGDDGISPDPGARQLKAIRLIAGQEFGLRPCPSVERKLWIRSELNLFTFHACGASDDFEALRKAGARIAAGADVAPENARRQARRMLYFLEPFEYVDDGIYLKTFLNSPTILDFIRWRQGDSELALRERLRLKTLVMHVIQEHFSGVRLPELIAQAPEVFITLNRRSLDVRQSAQIVLAKYQRDNFELELNKEATPAGPDHCTLVLKESSSGELLTLDLPFLDYVMMRRQGEVGQFLQASYVDRLDRFKSRLLKKAARQQNHDKMTLVRLQPDHTFKKQTFAVKDDILEVTND